MAGSWMQMIRVGAVVGLVGVLSPAAQVLAAPQAAARPARQTASKGASVPVRKVIELHQAKYSEDRILRTIAKEQLQTELSSDDLLALAKAGVSQRVIDALEGGAAQVEVAAGGSAQTSALSPEPAPAATLLQPSPALPSVASPPRLHRAYVDEFKWAALRGPVEALFGASLDIGREIRALLTTRIHRERKITLVERGPGLDQAIAEIDLQSTDKFNQQTKRPRGRFKGADFMLLGEVTTLGAEDVGKVLNLGTLFGPGASGITLGRRKVRGVVVISYRLVDVSTLEVVLTGEAKGISVREGKVLGFANVGTRSSTAGGFASGSAAFGETLLGEAVANACDQLAVIMNAEVPVIRVDGAAVEARVASVTGSSITITAGTNETVAAQDIFEVFRILKEIKDPVTGEILDNEVQLLGTMTVASVRERIATGTYTGMPIRDNEIAGAKILARRLQ